MSQRRTKYLHTPNIDFSLYSTIRGLSGDDAGGSFVPSAISETCDAQLEYLHYISLLELTLFLNCIDEISIIKKIV